MDITSITKQIITLLTLCKSIKDPLSVPNVFALGLATIIFNSNQQGVSSSVFQEISLIGVVNGSNTSYIAESENVLFINVDSTIPLEGIGYTKTGTTISVGVAPIYGIKAYGNV